APIVGLALALAQLSSSAQSGFLTVDSLKCWSRKLTFHRNDFGYPTGHELPESCLVELLRR
ncbi:hypothetical protein, partial [Bradyrhizobium sp. CCBAU 45389]|uniref:hypothetical protein n=1 Tax=Bradyrhizobium sp. CCBAU 45389 TaxID=858429 RepID=UPI002305ACEE